MRKYNYILLALFVFAAFGCEKDSEEISQEITSEVVDMSKDDDDCDNDLVFDGQYWISGASNAPSSYADDAITALGGYIVSDPNCRVQFNSSPVYDTRFYPVTTNCISSLAVNDLVYGIWLNSVNENVPSIVYSSAGMTTVHEYTVTEYSFQGVSYPVNKDIPHYEIKIKYENIICRDEPSKH